MTAKIRELEEQKHELKVLLKKANDKNETMALKMNGYANVDKE